MLELLANTCLLVSYPDTSSKISSFHDEDSQDSISSTESTSSNSSLQVRIYKKLKVVFGK